MTEPVFPIPKDRAKIRKLGFATFNPFLKDIFEILPSFVMAYYTV